MTALYTRKGRRFVVATPAQVAREVDRRTDYREAVAERTEARPDARCRTCTGLEDGGRVVQIEHGGWIWLPCDRCMMGEAAGPFAAAAVPADS